MTGAARAPRLQLACVVGVAAFLVAMQIRPRYLEEQFLHHAPMPLVLPALWIAARRRVFSDAGMVCIALFLCLHVLGARYIYSNVPYDEWSRTLFGVSVDDHFGWSRNQFDRLVHLAFGALAVLPVAEATVRWTGVGRRGAVLFALMFVGTGSAVYEVFEWLLTVVVQPARAERYNGQQGDFWDAQKDMALALAAALVVAPVVLRRLRRAGRPRTGDGDRRDVSPTDPPAGAPPRKVVGGP